MTYPTNHSDAARDTAPLLDTLLLISLFSSTFTRSSTRQLHLLLQQQLNTHRSSYKMSAQSQQIKQNFLNHPYTKQASQFASGQVGALDAELNKYPVLRDLEAKTRIPKAYGVIGLGSSAVVLIFFNMLGLAQPMSNLIGWVLPAYLSIQAIESPGTNDDKQWLTYWVVFGLLNLAESMGLRAILYWVPMYFVFKTLATVWLMLPATRGAETLYYHVVRPLVGNISKKAQASTGSANPFTKEQPSGFSMAGTTAPSSFEHEKTL